MSSRPSGNDRSLNEDEEKENGGFLRREDNDLEAPPRSNSRSRTERNWRRQSDGLGSRSGLDASSGRISSSRQDSRSGAADNSSDDGSLGVQEGNASLQPSDLYFYQHQQQHPEQAKSNPTKTPSGQDSFGSAPRDDTDDLMALKRGSLSPCVRSIKIRQVSSGSEPLHEDTLSLKRDQTGHSLSTDGGMSSGTNLDFEVQQSHYQPLSFAVPVPRGRRTSVTHKGPRHTPGERPGAYETQTRAVGETPAWINGGNNAFDNSYEFPRSSFERTNHASVGLTADDPLAEDFSTEYFQDPLSSTEGQSNHAFTNENGFVVDAQISTATEEKKFGSGRWWIIIAVILVILGGTGAALGVVLSGGGGGSEDSDEPTSLEPPSGPCDFSKPYFMYPDEQPSVWEQCACPANKITVVSPDTLAKYRRLQNMIEEILPSTDGRRFLSDTSVTENCDDPHNVALLDVASTGNGTDLVRYALLRIHDKLNGPGWDREKRWILQNSSCTWTGVTCNELGDGREVVTELELIGRTQLYGDFPSEITLLTDLESLDMSRNDFLRGTIPTELGRMSNLLKLQLEVCEVSGTIPTEIGTMTSLTSLKFPENLLLGTLPTELGNLQNLRNLHFGSNGRLRGTLPTELFQLQSLAELELNNNRLTGTVPTMIGSLSSIRRLQLNQNIFSGSVPTEIWGLTTLRVLGLSRIHLGGAFPVEKLLALPNLDDIFLDNCNLEGPLPTEIGLLTDLKILSMNFNTINETVVSEIGNLSGLSYLYLAANDFTGQLPATFNNLGNLAILELQLNSLTGDLTEMCDVRLFQEPMWRVDDSVVCPCCL